MKKIVHYTLVLFLFACASESSQPTTDNTADSHSAMTAAEEAPILPEFDYPIDSNYAAVLVIPNSVILTETAQFMKSQQVYGLFKGNEGYYLDQVNVIAKDYESENEEGVYQSLSCLHKDSCLFFVTGVDYLKAAKVPALELNETRLPIGKTLTFELNGKTQKLVATGTFREGKESDNFNDMMSYRLMLFGEKNENELTDMLVAHDSFDDTAIELLFVGDIDGDGLLDYLVETSRKYSYSAPALYLSKGADEAELIKLIDVATHLGGC